MTEPLFIRPDEQVTAEVPAFSRAECSLNFTKAPGCWGGSLGSWRDDDEHLATSSITIPTSPPFVYYKTDNSYRCFSPAELANELIHSQPESAAAQWLKDNANALNYAVQYYAVENLKAEITKAEKRIKAMRLKLNVDTVELNKGTRLSADERRALLLEFGGTDDLFT